MKKHKPEQIVSLLRQGEAGIANGKTTPRACREPEITEQTHYRWRREYGGLKLDHAKWLQELERENSKLKRLVAELSLEKHILKVSLAKIQSGFKRQQLIAVVPAENARITL